jgi:hypothetical protein
MGGVAWIAPSGWQSFFGTNKGTNDAGRLSNPASKTTLRGRDAIKQ